MSLVERLLLMGPSGERLAACEQALQRSERGRRLLENFEVSLQRGFLTDAQFMPFCTSLCAVLPPSSAACDAASITGQLDTPDPYYCQGPKLQSNPGHTLSRTIELRGFLFARLGRRPSIAEYSGSLQDWRLGRVGTRSQLPMRGTRPFFWVTPTVSIQSAGPSTPDRLRDLLGLSHVRHGFLLELQFHIDPNHALHRPTVLDALDHPTFYPAVGPDGWGITDDLSGPRPTPGLPEAVTPMATLECEVVARGDLTSPPPRF
jgi:hypothetical protein